MFGNNQCTGKYRYRYTYYTHHHKLSQWQFAAHFNIFITKKQVKIEEKFKVFVTADSLN